MCSDLSFLLRMCYNIEEAGRIYLLPFSFCIMCDIILAIIIKGSENYAIFDTLHYNCYDCTAFGFIQSARASH